MTQFDKIKVKRRKLKCFLSHLRYYSQTLVFTFSGDKIQPDFSCYCCPKSINPHNKWRGWFCIQLCTTPRLGVEDNLKFVSMVFCWFGLPHLSDHPKPKAGSTAPNFLTKHVSKACYYCS